MAIGVTQDAVFWPICTAFTSPDQVVAVPSRDPGDFLVAHGACSVLFLPQMQELSFPGQVLLCFHVKTFFKVGFLARIEWIASPLNGSMPLDFHIEGTPHTHLLPLSFPVLYSPSNHPVRCSLAP